VGYKFSLVLSRVVTDDESAILREAGCAGAVFSTDSLPTHADVPVTKMDFDDTVSPSLAEAIESGLEAVKKVPDLSVPGLTVPAQPAHAPAEDTSTVHESAGLEDTVLEGVVVGEPAAKKAPARKPRAKKTTAKASSADDAMEPAASR
jgi:hypothetical protein